MAQIFSPRSNIVSRASLFCLLLALAVTGWAGYTTYWSPCMTGIGVPREQPVPFSHKHHVDGLGIDCRYCHTSVETSPFAGMPATEICMSCHSQLRTQTALLEPVRQSFDNRKPIQWNRVNDLPDFVYFDHSIHVNKGIGCATCHGPVDRMPLTWKTNTLSMKWCLECHRAPENDIRPKEEVFNMKWKKPPDQQTAGHDLVAKYHVETSRLTNCSVCHH